MNEVKRVIYRDDQGRAWLYRAESVNPTDSSSSVAENVYDSEGRLRFTYIVDTEKGATRGKIERRLYFDENGRKIWEIWKRAGQSIYFLPETESQDYVTTPEQDFEKAASCPEITRQAKHRPMRSARPRACAAPLLAPDSSGLRAPSRYRIGTIDAWR